ncbi:hypothetical protein TNCV_1862771 [Trichonephila clavipes]|nr:hypothetical protein TNCV_1862771 [Trichonephila clavipes]
MFSKLLPEVTWKACQHHMEFLTFSKIPLSIPAVRGDEGRYQENRSSLSLLEVVICDFSRETLPLTLRDKEALGMLERKILRCILDGIQGSGSWRRRSILEL